MNKKDEIYDLLVSRMVGAQYNFGQRLSVKDLVSDTGASRQPIMAALNRLSSEGFVRIIPQVGCEVINPSYDQIADFYIMFERLEGLLTELAAARRTDSQTRDLRALQARILTIDFDEPRSAVIYCELNRAFHQLIHDMAQSPFLDARQNSNFDMSDFFINQAGGFNHFMADTAREHDEIIEAIASKSPARARGLAESHIGAVASSALAGLRKHRAAA
ncbi:MULTISPECIES: GntR family transcriptional regulator [unclassified Sphingopyxis]|uniref:GntR family transcriptional regulator n=2 Tax=Sphingomonadaceae TaxID=41297 RepID=UPI00050DFE24|nr:MULTISPECIES: GntR family transcriptional regulator [unclassified Sphingopyxis]MBA4751287.1 GntR family transcriptional regulator [Sphingopyxis sp.]MBN8843066.1 GntR family transcriptional regulator [Sphingomonadales bacterium]KGB52076.1 GntR family transcriptional regulator [Sphingopyxis sp. LC363]MDR6834032.1 DNA-binding GntR family transcriptional regulator [Sphingopyxis sp. BE122]MDR7226300.1 DNA-binding GntR family transcriptional regulator [Sphingopyxis sp. BE259]